MVNKAKPVDDVAKIKTKLLDIYTDFAEKHTRHPTRADMLKLGVSRDVIRHHFGSLQNLKDDAKERQPKSFAGIIDENFFTAKRLKAAQDDISKYKRFIVTTAVTGADVHDKFLKALRQYCKVNDALLLILMASDPASKGGAKALLDPKLAEEHIIFDDMSLNDNVFLSAIKLSAKHINPLTGLRRIGQNHGSFIFASPKQHLRTVSTSNGGLPHQMMTTGACTIANYSPAEDKGYTYMAHRTAYMAEVDHVLGAVIVEIQDDEIFHTRQVQADRAGGFADLGLLYHAGSSAPVKIEVEAFVLGDWHSGETDPEAAEAFVFGRDSVVNTVHPKRLIVHDGFNGMSISHHETRNAVLRAQRAQSDKITLHTELQMYAADLDRLSELCEEVVIVCSNHDDFLARYLQDGRFVEEPQNASFSSLLFHHMCNGKNPLRYAVETLIGLKHPERVRWLNRDEGYQIAGVELGAHGDKGANGSRGSLQSMADAYRKSISGHSHVAGILGQAFQVGTCSFRKLNYNQGPSSWIQTSCLLHSNGHRQLVNNIEGFWHLTTRRTSGKRGASKRKAA